MKILQRKLNSTLTSIKTFLLVSVIAVSTSVHADDTEVFYSVNVANNLLFLLDVSGSMKEKIVSVTTTVINDGTSTTISNEGNLTPIVKGVGNYRDDAIQNDTVTTTAGNQWHNSNDLDFVPEIAVGLQFFGLNGIPSNATITYADITFRSDGSHSQNTNINISIENTDWANNYSYSTKILSRPYLGSVPWSITNNWSNNNYYKTPDISSLIQQVIDQQGTNWGWANWGHFMNRIAFKFITTSGEREVDSADKSNASKRPSLYVEYNVNGGSLQTFVSRSGEISHGNDSSYQEFFDAEQWLTTSDDQVNDGYTLAFDDTQDVAVRFNLDANASTRIRQGSIIKSAHIRFQAAANDSSSSEIRISVEDTGDAQRYSSSKPKIKERNYAYDLPWFPESWANGQFYQTPPELELEKLVQYAVNRSDWDNSIAFLFHAVHGERLVYAQDPYVGQEPTLHIEFFDIGNVDSGIVTTPTTITETRIETRLKFMQEALEEVLTDPDTPNLNVGLMKYSGMSRDPNQSVSGTDNIRKHYVGGVVFPVKPIYATVTDIMSATANDNLPDPATGVTVGSFIPQISNQWSPKGGTPIVDALYEAALYFRGEQMHYGKERNTSESINSSGSHPSTYASGAAITKTVHHDGRSSIDNSRYISPIKSECQSNYIVLMSDGKPTYYQGNSTDQNKGPFARALQGTGAGFKSKISSCLGGNAESGNSGVELEAGTCGREITQYLATHDNMPSDGRGPENPGVDKKQVVKTFTIGFGAGLEDGAGEYLESLTTVDGKGYYHAEDKAQLAQAFKEIIQAVAEPSGSLASPGYSVNVKSGLEHEKDIYIPVFTRKNSSRWSGNLKKFRIADVNGKRTIQSRTGHYAVDELGGFNNDENTGAIDYWSTTTDDQPDGADVEKGGLANLLVPSARKLFSNLDCASTATSGCVLNTTKNTLTVNNAKDPGEIKDNHLLVDNAFLSYLGFASTEQEKARKRLINFIRGWKKGLKGDDTRHRTHMGDMLHSEPLVVTYKQGSADGTGKEQYIFAATNEGFLHAFNPAHEGANAGKEMFAFMPKELLKNIKHQFKNQGTAEDHKYGIDGVLSFWHDDKYVTETGNVKGDVDGADKLYLYFGLRRGGNSFYALDVTDINNPTLLWHKTKDSGMLSNMGQSWSAPYLARVGMADGTRKEVVIVSGGYDEDEDRDLLGSQKVNIATATVTATEGNDVFMFDAKTGDLIWSIRESLKDTSSIVNSIPGGVRIMDVTQNGVLDRLYFGDTGGNLWRLDLSEKLGSVSSTDSVSKLTKLAVLSTKNSSAARMFFNEPDVATMKPNGKTIYAVSIGSGFRAHPLDRTIEDKFFIINDVSPFLPLKDDYETVTIDSLAEVTITGSDNAISLSRSGFDDDSRNKGWFVSFEQGKGEKVLAPSVAYDGVITFTTLLPEILLEGVNFDPCEAPVTQGRFYALNMLTGKAVLDLNESFDPDDTSSDFSTEKDAFTTISKGEIPGKPQIVFNAVTQQATENGNGEVTRQMCLHPVDIRIGKKRSQATGYDACRLESVYWNNPEEN